MMSFKKFWSNFWDRILLVIATMLLTFFGSLLTGAINWFKLPKQNKYINEQQELVIKEQRNLIYQNFRMDSLERTIFVTKEEFKNYMEQQDKDDREFKRQVLRGLRDNNKDLQDIYKVIIESK